jgi:hypothetical protein
VGIDGLNSNSVEQIGTDSDCENGAPTYYAWFEFYPQPAYYASVAVHPGDVMAAQVLFSAKDTYTVYIRNMTTGRAFTTSARVRGALRSSAEWIAEAPSDWSGNVLPLSNFGSVGLGLDATGVAMTNNAVVNGVNAAMGSFDGVPFAQMYQLSMVSKTGGIIEAMPSPISKDKTSFTVNRLNVGP